MNLEPNLMRPLLLIQTGEAPESIRTRFGGIVGWFRAALKVEPADLRVVRVDQYQPLPAPQEIAGAVITGSSAMVTDRSDWSEHTAAWVHTALDAGTPLFGVCYGHQLMAQALGGTVGWLPAGREIGTETITRYLSAPIKGEVLGDLPMSFAAQTTHRQSVLEPPPGVEVLAHSNSDPNQLLRYAPLVLSTQFHPEFRPEYLRAYIAARADTLRKEGRDPEALSAAVTDTQAARALLERFARAALERNA